MGGIGDDFEGNAELAAEMLRRIEAGEKKSALEREYWGDGSSHGQRISAFIRRYLGVETVKRSPLSERLRKAESLLRVHGISIEQDELEEEYRLLARSREAALAALRVYNDPTGGFRTETFALLMIVAWNTLLQAVCHRDNIDYFDRCSETGDVVLVGGQPKVVETWALVDRLLSDDEFRSLRANLDFWVGLRNQVAHRYLPELDPLVIPEAQSLLFNYEERLAAEFGEEATLGKHLAVPLHLSGFRSDAYTESLKSLQSKLPADVNDYLSRHRQEQPEDVRRDSAYAMQVYLVKVAANRPASADIATTFIDADNSDELTGHLAHAAVITKERRVEVGTKGLLHPTEVSRQVEARTGLKFNNNRHVRAAKYFEVRPFGKDMEDHPERTKQQWCVRVPFSKDYGYRPAWVDKLVREFEKPGRYEEIVELPPEPCA